MKKRKKEIKLPQRFNPGTMSYESILPIKNSSRKLKIKVDWKLIIALIIAVIILLVGFLLALKYSII